VIINNSNIHSTPDYGNYPDAQPNFVPVNNQQDTPPMNDDYAKVKAAKDKIPSFNRPSAKYLFKVV